MSEENNLMQLAREAMRLEYNVSQLYMIFRDALPEDADFWWMLVIEETNHAALIKSGLDYFMPLGLFPDEILFPGLEVLQKTNQELICLQEQYTHEPPTREEAFNFALQTELSAGEIHFQNAMTKSNNSKALALFQKLNQDDRDHAKRIRAYMKENGIAILSNENFD